MKVRLAGSDGGEERHFAGRIAEADDQDPLAAEALALGAGAAVAAVGPARAQNATWQTNPGSGDFYDPNNWSPASVPTGTATLVRTLSELPGHM